MIDHWRQADTPTAALGEASLVLWQYVPHMYARGGLNLAVCRAMTRLQSPARRQLVIAHEIAAPISPWPHRLIYALTQRAQWRQIVRAADAIGISTEAWLQRCRSAWPQFQQKLSLCPSPALIPFHQARAGELADWKNKLNLDGRLLGFFGEVSWAKQEPWLWAAQRQLNRPGQPVALIFIGHQSKPTNHPQVRSLGYQPPRAVSLGLQAIDVLCLPFIDGASERRTSLMAGLGHGCAIATTIGPSTGPTLRRADFFAAAPADDSSAFTQAISRLLAIPHKSLDIQARARSAYGTAYDWPVVVGWVLENQRR